MSRPDFLRKQSEQFADVDESNEFNHTVDDFDIRPPRNELRLYSPRWYNNRLVIDSKSRNKTTYPSAANYTVDLEREYSDVISIELVQGVIPFSGFAINDNNNVIYFQESENEILKVLVPNGNYTAEELKQTVQDSMNAIGESNYTVSLLSNMNKLKITSDWTGGDGIFKLLFEGPKKQNNYDMTEEKIYRCNSIGPILGFEPDDTFCQYIPGVASSQDGSDEVCGLNTKFYDYIMIGDKIKFDDDSTEYTVTDVITNKLLTVSPNKVGDSIKSQLSVNSFIGKNSYDLDPVKYLALFLNELDTVNLNKVASNNNKIQNAFAIIPKFQLNFDNNIVLGKATLPNDNNIFYFYPVAKKITKLTIKFTDGWGNLYDFNGKEHFLQFNVRTLNDIGN